MSIPVNDSLTLFTGAILGLIDGHTGNYLKRYNVKGKWGGGTRQYISPALPPVDLNSQKDLASLQVIVNSDNTISFLTDINRFAQVVTDKNTALSIPDSATDTNQNTRRFFVASAGTSTESKISLKSQWNGHYLKTNHEDIDYTTPDMTTVPSEKDLGVYTVVIFGANNFATQIGDIEYDLDKVITSTAPYAMGSNTVSNSDPNITITSEISVQKSYSESQSFANEQSFTIGADVSVTAKVPLVEETQVSYSTESTYTWSSSSTTTTEDYVVDSVSVSVPPNTPPVTVYFSVILGTCTVPYTATVTRTDNAGQKYTFKVNGVYTGVNCVSQSVTTDGGDAFPITATKKK